MITSPEFCGSIYRQFEAGVVAGLDTVSCQFPVTDRAANRITLAARRAECAVAPHEIHLNQHPSGAITAVIESPLGLACPDPLAVMGRPVADVQRCSPRPANHAGLVIVSSPQEIFAIGRDYDGEYSPVRSVRSEHQRLFFAQVAGLVMARALRHSGARD